MHTLIYNEMCNYRASVQPTTNGVNRCYKRGLQKDCLGVNSQIKGVCVCVDTCVLNTKMAVSVFSCL